MRTVPAAGAVQRRITQWAASPGWPPVALSDGPTDRWVGKFIAALPGVFDESRQRLEVDGVRGFIESAPAELPGDLLESFFGHRRRRRGRRIPASR